MPNRKKHGNQPEGIHKKLKPQNSFSLPKELKAGKRRGTKKITRKSHPQRSSSETVAHSSASTKQTRSSISDVGQENNSLIDTLEIYKDTESLNASDNSWETDCSECSVETLRSEWLHTDESVIPPPALLRDIDSVSSTFLNHEHYPIYNSTPVSFLDSNKFRPSEPVCQPSEIPNVSYEKDFLKNNVTLEDVEFDLKPISPEQRIQSPNEPNEDINTENNNRLKDSFICSNVASSGEFQISEDSDEHTKLSKDDEYTKRNPFRVTVINKHTYSNSRKQILEDRVENSFKHTGGHRKRKDFGTAQTMQNDSKKKEKGFIKIKDSLIILQQKNQHRNLFEYKDESDNEDSFQNIMKTQNKELQDNESNNYQSETVTDVRNRKVHNHVEVDNVTQNDEGITTDISQSSTSERRKLKYAGENWFVETNKTDGEDNFENIRNKDDELSNNQPKTISLQRKGKLKKGMAVVHKRQKVPSTLDRLQHSTSLKMKQKNNGGNSKPETSEHRRKTNNRVRIASLPSQSPNSKDYFEEVQQNIEMHTPKRIIKYGSGIRTKLINRFKAYQSLDKSHSEDSFENIQSMQNELRDDVHDNNQLETTSDQIKRKTNEHVGVDEIMLQDACNTNRSHSTSLRRKHKDEEENLNEDANESVNEIRSEIFEKYWDGNSSRVNYNGENNFEEDRNMEIAITSKKRRKLKMDVDFKNKRHVSRSRKAPSSLSISKNSASQKVSEDGQNKQNKAIKSTWKICCLDSSNRPDSSEASTFHVLEPCTILKPIDSIAMIQYGLKSEEIQESEIKACLSKKDYFQNFF